MGILEAILVAASLCADCFAVSLCSGVTLRDVRWKRVLAVALAFAVIQAGLLAVGWAVAIPAALRVVQEAIPGLLQQTEQAENPFASLSENIEMVTLDTSRVCERLSYSMQDLIFFALFTLVTVLFCAAVVHVCTKRFHVRTLLNH